MIVVSNRIPVAKGYEDDFAVSNTGRRWSSGTRFLRLEILRPNPVSLHGREMGASDYHIVLTYWERTEDFVAWTESDDFTTAHSKQPPQEMFAGQNAFESHEIIQSAERTG